MSSDSSSVGLGARITEARKRKGLSRAALAKRVDLTSTAIMFLETGKSKDLAGANVFPMADALGVSARWLLTGVEGDDAPHETQHDAAVLRLSRLLAVVDEERLHAVMTLLNVRINS